MEYPLTPLFRQLDPAPIEGDDPRYVDWQRELGADDVKTRLISSIWNAPSQTGSIRLLAGPAGAGKSSELRRVRQRLTDRSEGRQAFVSFLESKWLDLDDITATDVSFNMVRQLVDDLRKKANIDLRTDPFTKLGERAKQISLNIGVFGVGLSTALREQPAKRKQLRELLDSELPTIWDEVNELIDSTRSQFIENGIERIVIMVDDLDKVRPREIREGLTNLDVLYLSDAGKLKALRCDVVLTVPIEYWYSSAGTPLQDAYGEVLELGLLPTESRHDGAAPTGTSAEEKDGTGARVKDGPGVASLRQILSKRFAAANASVDALEGGQGSLDALIRLSGGQIRLVFQALRAAIDRSGDGSEISKGALERAVGSVRLTFRRGLNARHLQALSSIAETYQADTTDPIVAELLRTSRVLPYVSETGDQWYGVHPLLRQGSSSP